MFHVEVGCHVITFFTRLPGFLLPLNVVKGEEKHPDRPVLSSAIVTDN